MHQTSPVSPPSLEQVQLSIHLVAMVMDEDTGWSHAAEESKPQCN